MKNDQNARDQSSVNRACSSAASSSTSARATSTETTPVLATKETPSEVPTGAGSESTSEMDADLAADFRLKLTKKGKSYESAVVDKPDPMLEDVNMAQMFARRSSSGRKPRPAAWLAAAVGDELEKTSKQLEEMGEQLPLRDVVSYEAEMERACEEEEAELLRQANKKKGKDRIGPPPVRSKMESEECELAMLMEMYAHPACGPSSHKNFDFHPKLLVLFDQTIYLSQLLHIDLHKRFPGGWNRFVVQVADSSFKIDLIMIVQVAILRFVKLPIDSDLFYFPYLGVFVRNITNFPHNSNVEGGILADEMGLGKTVEILSLILSHSPERSPKVAQNKASPEKTNETCPMEKLVYSSAAGCSESESMPPPRKRRRYDSSKKPNKKLCVACTSCSDLYRREEVYWKEQFDAECKQFVCPVCIADSEMFFDISATLIVVPEALLHQWYEEIQRLCKGLAVNICLDESQLVASKVKAAAKMCSMLRSSKRWCVTGTPLATSVNGMRLFLF
ncbi:unnamed protein product [Heligmosomoides polygyrus]|uniref:SNF2_N domain-containing protein n=1 Tax=Heligmosomoides polygyrus TaxID=6339 RepID=A0A3P8A264_HELPZ|nr:unnamed protein product [Heligmosomoides polygyrus]